jgi:host factor-I protein
LLCSILIFGADDENFRSGTGILCEMGAGSLGILPPYSGRVTETQSTRARTKAILMASDKQNLQDAFLNHVRKTKIPVTIFLINGVKLQGVITWFDNFCVLLRRDGQSQLVYKHAISTIMPAQPISLYEGEDAQ